MKKHNQTPRNPVYIRLWLDVLFAIAAIAGYAWVSLRVSREQALRLAWLFLLGYLFTVLITALVFRLTAEIQQKEKTEALSPSLGKLNLTLLGKLDLPLVVCDKRGRIEWMNRLLGEEFGRKNNDLYKETIEELTGESFEKLTGHASEELLVTIGEKIWHIVPHKIEAGKRGLYAFEFEDRTELLDTRQQLADEDTVVAHIVLDNLDELAQISQDRSRTAASDVEIELEKWAASVGGILKEYEREKFLFLFEKRHLAAMEENRFDVLDRIREIRVGGSDLPVTVSIGIAKVKGSLDEKSRASAACLDMALQRGGDQVVVKDEDGVMEFYGGKVKTVQKRTRVRARIMANLLVKAISEASNVLIMMHRYPDFDAIGAALGVLSLADYCKVKGNIIVSVKDPNFARCASRLRRLPTYRDGSAFVSPEEAQEHVGAQTLLVIVDVNNREQFEVPQIADLIPGERTVIIDHHRKTKEFAEKPEIEYIEPSASSACELITEMLELTGSTEVLDKEEADIMYAGIALDTKQFVQGTGVRTFSAALYLRGVGANPGDAQTLFKTDLSDFESEARFENNVELYHGVYAIASYEPENGGSSVRISAAKAADKLLTVENIKASFALCRMDGNVHISARSSGEINVQLIMEKLGGGGHFDASATLLRDVTMDEGMKMLKDAIDGPEKNNQ